MPVQRVLRVDERGVHRELFVGAGDGERPQRRTLPGTSLLGTLLLGTLLGDHRERHLAAHLDEDIDPGGAKEVHIGQINQRAVGVPKLLAERLVQPGRGHHVDIAAYPKNQGVRNGLK